MKGPILKLLEIGARKGVVILYGIDASRLGKNDISSQVVLGKQVLTIDWLDFGISIITKKTENGCEVVGSFNWKRASTDEIANAVYEAYTYQG
jgi:hypothetical protein